MKHSAEVRLDPRAFGIRCPCCSDVASIPTIDMVLQHVGIMPGTKEAAILTVLWRHKGLSVPTSRIFDAMCAEDASGGPGENTLRRNLKFSILRLRTKLAGSGMAIEYAGHGRGYRLKIERKAR